MKPHLCPVCLGAGQKPRRFYEPEAMGPQARALVKCRAVPDCVCDACQQLRGETDVS